MIKFFVNTCELKNTLTMFNHLASPWSTDNLVQLSLTSNDLSLAAQQGGVETTKCLTVQNHSGTDASFEIEIISLMSMVDSIRDETTCCSFDEELGLLLINCWDGTEFTHPTVEPIKPFEKFAIKPAKIAHVFEPKQFRPLFHTLRQATSFEETRYYLNSVYWDLSELPKATLVATDGHKLVTYAYDLPKFVKPMAGPVIPRTLIEQTLRLCGNSRVTLNFDGKYLCTEFNGMRVAAEQIDGIFPDYRSVTPNASQRPHIITFDRKHFLSMVEKLRGVKTLDGWFECDAENKVRVGARRNGDGTPCLCTITTQVNWPQDCTLKKIGFNPNYLHQYAKSAIGKEVTFCLCDDAMKPALFFDGNKALTRVLMPRKTS
ncbi:MAG: DNA polymerase III sliding clamp (beta) subunit (PCNA family) [Maritalea sp.]